MPRMRRKGPTPMVATKESTKSGATPTEPQPPHEPHEGDEGHEDAPTQPPGGGELAVLDKATLVAWLNGEDITVEDESDELDYATALRILTAESAEDVLSTDDVRKVVTLDGQSFVVRDLAWRRSTKQEDGKGRYAVMHCVDADGVPFITSCGATKVVLQLRKAQLEGWLPWQVELSISQTSNNRTVYELVAPTEPF